MVGGEVEVQQAEELDRLIPHVGERDLRRRDRQLDAVHDRLVMCSTVPEHLKVGRSGVDCEA